ncbi:membrane protease FtsH catalytic subunit [Sphaerotilus hippei]|uniref:ATP-dependent zinc metalloprotease FtsH n=2 Tax=Sphaerotilus hippei TaxID=744406 RepID=A0A318HE45_9BURK|nr:membrane protease FtsH catalytic subunit [Sphaerotilus hippei]
MADPDKTPRPAPSTPPDAPWSVFGVPRQPLWVWMIALLALFGLRDLWVTGTQVQAIPYSEFVRQLKDDQLQSLRIGGSYIEGELKTATADGRTRVVTTRVDPALVRELEPYAVRYEGIVENTLLRDLLSWIVPAVVLFGLWTLLGRRLAQQGGLGGMLSVGKSRARVHGETEIPVRFDDVAGVDEAKAELRESVDFLKSPQAWGRLGARMPKGVLLVGPPGTGKTLLARAMAGEAGVPFFSITGSEFVEMFVGVGAARVRDLFEQARAAAPCIIFIDELDALGGARGLGGLAGGHDEKEQTLNQLLAEMDGFDASLGVVILGATNRPEVLDAALLRAGRFDRQVLVDRPDRLGRAAILRVHLRQVRVAPGVDAGEVAALTPGFAGADLANLVNEAALGATRRGAAAVEAADFTVAIERIVAGLEKRQRVMNAPERRRVAVHECGHAIVAMSLPDTDPVHKISIIPRGIGALGYTLQRPTEDRYLATRGELEHRMAVLMGGRAAEQVVLGEISTGASDDLAKVTDIAHDMVTRHGMAAALGQVVFERTRTPFLSHGNGGPPDRAFGDATADAIDAAVRDLVDGAYEQALALLQQRRELLDRMAGELLAHETLDESALAGFVEQARRAGLGGP